MGLTGASSRRTSPMKDDFILKIEQRGKDVSVIITFPTLREAAAFYNSAQKQADKGNLTLRIGTEDPLERIG